MVSKKDKEFEIFLKYYSILEEMKSLSLKVIQSLDKKKYFSIKNLLKKLQEKYIEISDLVSDIPYHDVSGLVELIRRTLYQLNQIYSLKSYSDCYKIIGNLITILENRVEVDHKKPKLIILMGTPGSGKSKISKYLLPMGIRHICSDKIFEKLLIENGLPLDFSQMDEKMYKKAMQLRDIATQKNDALIEMTMTNKQSIMVESSGSPFSIDWLASKSVHYNYEAYVIFVVTSLDVALLRNKSRKRKLPEEVVKKMYNKIQQSFRTLNQWFSFGDIRIVMNNKKITTRQELLFFEKKILREVSNIMGKKTW